MHPHKSLLRTATRRPTVLLHTRLTTRGDTHPLCSSRPLHRHLHAAATIVPSAILARSALLALSQRPSLSWRLTHCWHCLDSSRTLRSLAVRRSLSDGLTLGAHLTVVAPSATCLFLLLAYRSPAPIELLRSCFLQLRAHSSFCCTLLCGPCRQLAGSGSHRCHQM